METRWNKLTEELIAPDIRHKWWTRICQTLANTKQRKYYYNLEYLERRFNLYDPFVDRLGDPAAVALAMFFQHLHYDPRLHGMSEELTLATLDEFANDSNLPKELMEKVRRLLEAAIANSTPVHLTPGASGADDEHFFLDFETAILGSSPSDYADFAVKMRDEYGFMPDVDYLQLRLKVLRCFLMIPNIFATTEFRNQYETQARENITKEIQTIQDQLQQKQAAAK